jgi:hypothetical protein
MKQLLSRLRGEAAVMLAVKYPDVMLVTIAEALGFKSGSWKTSVSEWMRVFGVRRPQGIGSPAYDQKTRKKFIAGDYIRKFDHRAIRKALLAHPELKYWQIGLLPQCTCSGDNVRWVAKKYGLQRRVRRKAAGAK